MRRADRLFRLVQHLRKVRTVTAAELAAELEVSERTIYRDVRDLVLSGVPIEGEAGVGYMLPEDFDLPPLMFDEGELAALVLGVGMVRAFADRDLAQRASSILQKVEAVLPARMRPMLEKRTLWAPAIAREGLALNLEPLREAIGSHEKVRFEYRRADGSASERTVRPLGLYFWGNAWTLVAWCELREDFRNFRPDRMDEVFVTGETFVDEPGRDLATFLAHVRDS